MNTKKTLSLVLLVACAVPLLVLALTELRAQRYTGQPVPTLQNMLVGGVQPLTFSKVNAGWKYKKKGVENSQQMCTFGGTVPTSYGNFNDISNFALRSSATHAYTPSYTTAFAGFDHTFPRDPAAVKGGGTKYSQKFFQPMRKSVAHGKPVKYGQFAASIKNGQMKFMYQIPKGNASGMMVETDKYQYIQNCTTSSWFREYTREKVEGMAQLTFVAGEEMSYGEQNCRIKMSKAASKVKLLK
jgi:hypothetical protein